MRMAQASFIPTRTGTATNTEKRYTRFASAWFGSLRKAEEEFVMVREGLNPRR